MKDWADKNQVWGTPRGHLQGQTRDNSNTRFSHLHNICIYMCDIISYLRVFTLFYHIPHTFGMHMSLEIYKNKKKTGKMKHA